MATLLCGCSSFFSLGRLPRALGLGLLAAALFALPSPASAGGWGWGWGWPGGYSARSGWAAYPSYDASYDGAGYYSYGVYSQIYYSPVPVYYAPTYHAPTYAYMPPEQSFIVFFDFDKSTLSPAGAAVLDEAIADVERGGVTYVQITGYTDAAGTVRYNLGLSERRAQAVRNYMAAHGVPADEIGIAWLGKSHQRVATPDGVREPQNRRVEISLAPSPVAQSRRPGPRAFAVPPMNLASAGGGNCRGMPSSAMVDGQRRMVQQTACRQ